MNGRHTWSKGLISAIAVMVLTGGMVAGLFYEASAVEMTIDSVGDAPHDGQSEHSFEVQITIPEDQHILIDEIRAVVESADNEDKENPVIEADESCDFPFTGPCPETTQGPSIIQNIAWTNEDDIEEGAHGYGYVTFEHTGYGYDDDHGYGYGPMSVQDYANGYGYGYGHEDGATLNFIVTLNPSQLDTGDHWLTFIVDTGLDLPFQLQTEAKHFVIESAPSSPGGGGGGGGPTAAPSLGSPMVANPGETATFTGLQLPDFVNEFTITFDDACEGCIVDIDAGPDQPPAAPQAPGVNAMAWFSLDITQDGDSIADIIRDGTLDFNIPAENLGDTDPESVFLLRAADGWEALSTTFTGVSMGMYTFEAELPGFSYFTAASSEDAPELIEANPAAGATIGPHAPVVEITLHDEAGIDLDATTLQVGGADVSFDANPLTSSGDHCKSGECTLTYDFGEVFPGGVPEGTYGVHLEAVDASGNTLTHSFSFAYETACNTPPNILDREPRDGAILNENTVEFTLHVAGASGACALDLDTLQFRVNFEPIDINDLTLDEDRDDADNLVGLSVMHPAQLEDGVHTLDVRVANQIGQLVSAAWVITTDETAPQVTFIEDPTEEIVPLGVDEDLPLPERVIVATSTPSIVIGFEEPTSGIDADETRLLMDGEELAAEVTATEIRYTFEDALDDGEYAMTLVLTDQAGNQETHTWTMEVDTGLPAYLLFVMFLVAVAILAAVGYGVYKRRPPKFGN